jgi:hypothetical protein
VQLRLGLVVEGVVQIVRGVAITQVVVLLDRAEERVQVVEVSPTQGLPEQPPGRGRTRVRPRFEAKATVASGHGGWCGAHGLFVEHVLPFG